MKKARYNRISTANQNLERQLKRNHPDELIFNDVVSGAVKFKDRVQGEKLMNAVKEGKIDFVSVDAVDRLGRNIFDVITTLEFFTNNNVVLRVDNLGIESLVNGKPNQVFTLIISVLGNVAEMERSNIRERQLQGIALAKAKGKYKGRVKGSSMSNSEFLEKYSHVVQEIRNHQDLSLRKIVKLTDSSLGTVQKVHRLLKSQKI